MMWKILAQLGMILKYRLAAIRGMSLVRINIRLWNN